MISVNFKWKIYLFLTLINDLIEIFKRKRRPYEDLKLYLIYIIYTILRMQYDLRFVSSNQMNV